VSQNLIWANYGSSQGFDTDDGSSWYNISNNFMYQADGYKMDFGGHDTMVNDNMFYKFKGDGQNCINTWPYLYNHGTEYKGNKCMLPEAHNIGSVNGCDCPGDGKQHAPTDTHCGVSLSNNEYYGFKANLTMSCGGSEATFFSDWQVRHPLPPPHLSPPLCRHVTHSLRQSLAFAPPSTMHRHASCTTMHHAPPSTMHNAHLSCRPRATTRDPKLTTSRATTCLYTGPRKSSA
jgi:hypothetical protein